VIEKVVIFGVGLIGGSFARALRHAGVAGTIVGVGRSPKVMARALELGIIDQVAGTAQEAMRGASLVLIAAPVAQTGAILTSLLPYLEPQTVITDAGSTKADVVATAREVLAHRVGQFVPGHPIAGRETNGPDAAIFDLYLGKKVVLTPLPENPPEMVARVEQAWANCGAVLHRLAPEEHDKVFATVSHLPHLLAFALVDDVANKPHSDLLFQFAASGFRDFTRIAASSPEMWRDITLANQPALLGELDAYLAQLMQLRAMLAVGDGPGIEAVYANARRARRQWTEAIEAAEAPPPDIAE
jgi:prephenate dehydrogenase